MTKYLNVLGFFLLLLYFFYSFVFHTSLENVPRWKCLIVKPKSHVFSGVFFIYPSFSVVLSFLPDLVLLVFEISGDGGGFISVPREAELAPLL